MLCLKNADSPLSLLFFLAGPLSFYFFISHYLGYIKITPSAPHTSLYQVLSDSLSWGSLWLRVGLLEGLHEVDECVDTLNRHGVVKRGTAPAH